MDTKSRSVKPGLALLAFILGITLLLYSGAGWLYLLVSTSSATRVNVLDAFRSDYQQTAAFRSMLGSDLYSLLHYAVSSEYYASPPLAEEDVNLLYLVEKGDMLRSSNTAADLSSPDTLPEGYNFLLRFTGGTASIWKDGRELDVYGDGFFRGTEEDWYVPGYANGGTHDEAEYDSVTVYIAAAAEPADYGTGYGPYSLVQDMTRVRTYLIWLLLVPPAAGVAFLVWAILWRKHKLRADQAVAWFTGHIWLEVKAALLIPLVFLWCGCAVSLIELFVHYNYGGIVWCLATPLPLWWSYFCLNDLRYNLGQLRSHSFCAACVRLFRRQELGWTVQKRMDRRAVLQFVLCVPFFLVWAAQFPNLYLRRFYSGLLPLLLAGLFLAGAALIAAQIRLMTANRKTTADTDKLLTHIQAAGAGQPTGALVLPEDSDLRQAADSLGHMEDGLRAALAEQMKSERTKIELIANVSHDLKTPLTSIVSYVELLQQEEGLPEHVRDYVRILAEKAQRLQTMVRDVFEVSKAAAGNLPVAMAPLDYAKLLRQTLADMSEEIEAASASLRPRLPQEPVWIEADGDRLYRVFQNLIGNALKYALEGSRIYLDLNVDQGQAAAVLRNISRDELPQDVDLTERFVRGDASRTDGGSGLGLSIARTFTEACGGSFTLRTEADLFTVQVSFPLTDKRPAEEPPAE
ncbi:sensor histidine kinase [Intestinimonas massiliensis (ex Afouda et al. 2020)]|uniref:sensor histidine kinase n=1 Tax=Intestinimonas massiliensis (ex Afouda et al. 2020) TaxID=1673721 RepID=UPI0010314CD1|nr:HAMP domain-containing sensor histidine kinase [Intestinimonas massiliensis (ex Afouda et al. 2020)]